MQEDSKLYKQVATTLNLYYTLMASASLCMDTILRYADNKDNKRIQELKYKHNQMMRQCKLIRNMHNQLIEDLYILSIDNYSDLLKDANYLCRIISFIIDRSKGTNDESILKEVEQYIKNKPATGSLDEDFINLNFTQK